MNRPSGGGEPFTATVLFTDLVSSTEVRVALGDDAADELRRIHDPLLRSAVEAERGRVVKGTGDGLLATFSAASDALSAAVAAQRAIARHNRSAPHSLSVRVGLAVGDVSFEEDDCFGLPVVEAARLCAAAAGGQILASQLVRLLAGSRGGHTYIPVGDFELKGMGTAVDVVEVVWASDEDPTVPLPLALDSAGGFRFVGRAPELAQLLGTWKETATDGRRVVLLAGEPGIGKTRLAAELAQAVHHDGATVLYGRCDEELGLPYQPFAQALRGYAATCPPEELATQLGPLGGELARLAPTLPERVPGLAEPLKAEPETERYRLFEAFVELLSGASAAAPVLVVLDDLHWADRPTLALLRHVLQAPVEIRLLVLGTYRDSEVGRAHPLADLSRDLGVERLSLDGLGEDAVGELLAVSSGGSAGAIASALARAVYRQTDGNAFFVGEVLRHIREVGGVPAAVGTSVAEATVAELGVTEGVREVVGRRLSRLPGAAAEVLVVAAVVGREFDVALLLDASDVDRDGVLEALEHAEEARLITPARRGRADRYLFAHAVVRSTIYDDVPAGRRARIHRRIGEALEGRRGADVAADLAHHFSAAGPAGSPAKATAYGIGAGDRALEGLAHEQAAAFYGLALEALDWTRTADGLGQRGEVLLARGRAWRRAGDMERARRDFLDAAGVARAVPDAAVLARAALGVGEASAVWGRDPDLESLLDEALGALGDTDLASRARLLGRQAQAVYFTGGPHRRRALSTEAVAAARTADDPSVLADVLRARHVVLTGPDELTERLAVADEIVSLADIAGDPEMAIHGRAWRIVDLLESGDGEALDRELATHAELAQQLRQPLHLRDVALWRGTRAALSGRFAEAQGAMDEAQAMGQLAGDAHATAIHIDQRTLLAYSAEQTAELVRWRPAFADCFGDLGEEPARQAGATVLALIDLRAGQVEKARGAFDELMSRDPADLPRNTVWLAVACMLSQTCADLDDSTAAAALYDLLLPHAHQVAVIDRAWVCWGSASHYLGLLAATMGRHEEARTNFEAALAVHRRLGARPLLVATQCGLARALLALGDPGLVGEAERLAARASDAAEEMGLALRSAEARQLLGQARTTPSGADI